MYSKTGYEYLEIISKFLIDYHFWKMISNKSSDQIVINLIFSKMKNSLNNNGEYFTIKKGLCEKYPQ